jgi:hypothetical protein
MIEIIIFAAGMWCGYYLSPWIDDKLAPKGDD